MQRSITAWPPFLAYGAIVAIHLAQIVIGDPGRGIGKALLMPVLLGVVLWLALGRHRAAFHGRRERTGLVLLCVGIAFSWAGDVLLEMSFLIGLSGFALAHITYILLFTGPARSHRPTAWAVAPVAWTALLVPVLWPHLGELAVVVLLYAFVLAGTAATSTGVSAAVGIGGALFLASDSLLAFRLFWPDFASVFPDPWQDVTVMALYCAGEGLIAYGVVRRLIEGPLCEGPLSEGSATGGQVRERGGLDEPAPSGLPRPRRR
ncbi:lysoplasmalogenase [Microbacterium sp. NPDC096154]|uniref:lysoplasmalogenase n=1 Tax=Microbacterium sp. NPDC096154 TaxID=3155549 RepID=UPI00333397A0